MLTKSQLKLLRDLQTKKGRKERGMFVIEGDKFVREASQLVEFMFTARDTGAFTELMSTVSPQTKAAVARIPSWNIDEVLAKDIVVVLDNVQDPGNVGTILRACLGFGAALILVESADVTNPKVVRASTSALLRVPWVEMKRDEAEVFFEDNPRRAYRLEVRGDAITPEQVKKEIMYIVAGNEGSGISLNLRGQSVHIPHDKALESLNVAIATSIVLYQLHRK